MLSNSRCCHISNRLVVYFLFVILMSVFTGLSTTSIKMEMQAIILAAGAGSRMRELTRKKAKCLLPIGNKPMIFYPIQSLVDAGFKDIMIIVPDKHQQEIESEVKNLFSHDARLCFDFFSIVMDEQYGTAESLFQVKDKIHTDCIVVSCDVITNYSLVNMINVYRTRDPSLVTLFSNVNPTATTRCFGSSKSGRVEKDLIGLDIIPPAANNFNSISLSSGLDEHHRLVFFHSESDFGQSIPFSTDMILKTMNLSLISNYFDAHVYILKKSALDAVFSSEAGISSLKGEVIPVLVKQQFEQRKPIEEHPGDVNGISLFERTALTFDLGSGAKGLFLKPNKSSSQSANCIANIVKATQTASVTAGNTDVLSSGLFCIRSNSLSGFIESNKRIALENSTSITPQTPGGSSRGRNCINSLISDINTTVSANAHVIRSIIGANCSIHASVKISDSVVMDGVVIEEGVVLQATVVCADAKIGKKSSLERCLVSSGYKIHAESQFVDEFLADGTEAEFVF